MCQIFMHVLKIENASRGPLQFQHSLERYQTIRFDTFEISGEAATCT